MILCYKAQLDACIWNENHPNKLSKGKQQWCLFSEPSRGTGVAVFSWIRAFPIQALPFAYCIDGVGNVLNVWQPIATGPLEITVPSAQQTPNSLVLFKNSYYLESFFFLTRLWFGRMAQQLRALTALSEDAPECYTDLHAGKTPTYIKVKKY